MVGALLTFGYLSYSTTLNIFALAVSHRWLILLEGSAGTVGLFILEKFVLKVPISKVWYAAILAGFMFFGCFQVWEGEYLSRAQREKDLVAANGDRDKWKALAAREQSNNISQLTAVVQPERPDSLRRRAKRLADDIDQFWIDRNESHPPHTNGRADATGEQAEINRKSDEYERDTNKQCLERFGDQIIGVPRELRAKGLDVRHLDQYNPPRCLYPSMPESMMISETDILRYLAYMLDANDRVIHFMPVPK
jgi:hypothetical protein